MNLFFKQFSALTSFLWWTDQLRSDKSFYGLSWDLEHRCRSSLMSDKAPAQAQEQDAWSTQPGLASKERSKRTWKGLNPKKDIEVQQADKKKWSLKQRKQRRAVYCRLVSKGQRGVMEGEAHPTCHGQGFDFYQEGRIIWRTSSRAVTRSLFQKYCSSPVWWTEKGSCEIRTGPLGSEKNMDFMSRR